MFPSQDPQTILLGELGETPQDTLYCTWGHKLDYGSPSGAEVGWAIGEETVTQRKTSHARSGSDGEEATRTHRDAQHRLSSES